MGKRISKRVREEAAMLCALMASGNRSADGEFLVDPEYPFPRHEHQDYFGEPCDVIGVEVHSHDGPAELARLAYWSVTPECRATSDEIRADWAEAESLLRTGWVPK